MAESTNIHTNKSYDVAVIGAGVFGSWTAYQLQKMGRRVILLDAYGAAHSRASSGGESRIIRCGYGNSEIYTRWALRSMEMWQELFTMVTGLPLFHRTGVLWLAKDDDVYAAETLVTLQRVGVPCERLSRAELEARFPQMNLGDVTWGILESESGALIARRAVHTVVQEAIKVGVEFAIESVLQSSGTARLNFIQTASGAKIKAESFVFACGPWLPKLFPEILRSRIRVTKQDVFFFGIPAGDGSFAPPAMPVWVHFAEEIYGIPDLENRGLKIGVDRHGEAFDPDSGNRQVNAENFARVKVYLAKHLPAMKDAPLVETRVCQYENTSNGDFLIDRHPDYENVWLVGGGSGHGFKHGPALGEYTAARVTGNTSEIEPRFSLSTKEQIHNRLVF
jgi:monomeric sarcosine oxidase